MVRHISIGLNVNDCVHGTRSIVRVGVSRHQVADCVDRSGYVECCVYFKYLRVAVAVRRLFQTPQTHTSLKMTVAEAWRREKYIN